jgi:exonuclease SbcC
LTNVSSLPRPDLFVIDEGFGALDDANLEACGRLITSLTRYFKKVLIISHIDQIKDLVDNMIEVTRVEKDARVVVE